MNSSSVLLHLAPSWSRQLRVARTQPPKQCLRLLPWQQGRGVGVFTGVSVQGSTQERKHVQAQVYTCVCAG